MHIPIDWEEIRREKAGTGRISIRMFLLLKEADQINHYHQAANDAREDSKEFTECSVSTF